MYLNMASSVHDDDTEVMRKLNRASEYLANPKTDVSTYGVDGLYLSKLTAWDAFRPIWLNDFFPHITVENFPANQEESRAERVKTINQHKLWTLDLMVVMYIEHLAGLRSLNDRDDWSNKRGESPARSIEVLFRSAWQRNLKLIQGEINEINSGQGRTKRIDFSQIPDMIKGTAQKNVHIEYAIINSFVSIHWGIKKGKIKNNVSQTLNMDSQVSMLTHLNNVDVNIDRSDRQTKIRQVQYSQYGFICCVHTPEGKNSGLLKSLAITADFSVERDDDIIISRLLKENLVGISDTQRDMPLVVNGKFIGWCNKDQSMRYLIDLRRSNKNLEDITVVNTGKYVLCRSKSFTSNSSFACR